MWRTRNRVAYGVAVGWGVAPKVREVMRRLEREGWYLFKQKGSHRQFKHPARVGKVTVPGAPNDELQEGTWQSIQKQAGWRR